MLFFSGIACHVHFKVMLFSFSTGVLFVLDLQSFIMIRVPFGCGAGVSFCMSAKCHYYHSIRVWPMKLIDVIFSKRDETFVLLLTRLVALF